MSLFQAKEQLKTAKSINDWNAIWDMLKWQLSPYDMAIIDSCGLIVEVLGKDPVQAFN